ncbi:hypothetical protein JL722_10915 [Aureococcus anophagefferens]|nr:hypothetical protein JL722_10915 [Aureococcus anophagefferens]
MLLASRTARCLVRVAPRSAARFAPLRRASTAEPAAPDAVDPSSLESAFLREFIGRGYLAQCTDLSGLDEAMSGGPVAAYLGFDATADSLHVGSLLQIMILRLLQKHGHTPVVLVGGGTTKVGDPSGKDESRKLLDDDAIAGNIAGISSIFDKFLDFGPGGAVLVNNADWLDELAYVKFLREFGSHFSVNRMLSFESAYDFVELARRYDVKLQLGGSDQWGNIVSGVELARRRVDRKSLVGLTAPLIATSDGRKMGKTAEGAVWLSPGKLAPYDYWQFWRNTVDDDVVRFTRMFTDAPLEEVDALERELAAAPDAAAVNAAKRRLADACTTLLHGADALPDIHATVDRLFAGGGGSAASLPRVAVGDAEITVVDALVSAGFAKSKSEAKRLIKGGGARLDGAKVDDVDATVALEAGVDVKLSSGKKKHAILELAG